MQKTDDTPNTEGGHVCSTAELGRSLVDELRELAEDGSKVHSPGMPEHTICRGLLALLKENERLRAMLARCRPIIDSDAQMMDDIRRHAPLDADSQATHDATEYESEKLARELEDLFGPNDRGEHHA